MRNATAWGWGIALLLLGGGVAALYFLVYVPFLGPLLEKSQQLERIKTMNEKIERQGPFSPPADTHLTEAQIDRFLAVQRTVYDSVHTQLQDAVATIQKLEQKDQSGEEPSFSAVTDWLSSFSEALTVFSEALTVAKRVQVQALNTHEFSFSEYRWVRKQVFHAAGWTVPPLGVEPAMGQSRAGLYIDREKKPFSDPVPAQNRGLVAPHRTTIDSLDIVARFGL
jgi:type II secretory pathway component PulM